MKGMDNSPGLAQGGQPAGRRLVRRPPVALQIGVERLEHHPLAGRDRPQPAQLVGAEGTGVGVGEEPGLIEHRRAGGGQVVDGGGEAVLASQSPGRRVAVLGGFAQGEERLVAAGGRAGPGDGQDLVGTR